jgi:hypothetical protein
LHCTGAKNRPVKNQDRPDKKYISELLPFYKLLLFMYWAPLFAIRNFAA